tara:strand:- start:2146 stop:2757 length:612 start_codon:yes stop_codon:yes gene_type:complete
MKISYAITVCNEIKEIKKLISFILENKRHDDEIVVLFDKQSGTAEVWSYLQEQDIKCEAKSFQHHFADWKNYLTSLCSGDYIFQIDADELPHKECIETLPMLLTLNPDVDVMLVPRVNTVEGLTQDHIAKWRWSVNEKGWVNWPDYQWRIYRNSEKIKWVNKVHEKLEGFDQYATLPMLEEHALYHPKDIKRQEKQNKYYNTL